MNSACILSPDPEPPGSGCSSPPKILTAPDPPHPNPPATCNGRTERFFPLLAARTQRWLPIRSRRFDQQEQLAHNRARRHARCFRQVQLCGSKWPTAHLQPRRHKQRHDCRRRIPHRKCLSLVHRHQEIRPPCGDRPVSHAKRHGRPRPQPCNVIPPAASLPGGATALSTRYRSRQEASLALSDRGSRGCRRASCGAAGRPLPGGCPRIALPCIW